jgi:uncharacterized protein (TIGR02001 family)
MDATYIPIRMLAVIAALAAGTTARAELSSTWTLASDYDFRGVSNSATDPVLQASLDYEAPNGFWIGAWASNFDYGPEYDGTIELDLYAGYTHTISETRSWSAGVTAYTFPGSDDPIEIDTSFEGYVEVTLDSWHAAQWYSPDYAKAGASAFYTEANYTWTLPRDFSLRAHAGYAWGNYWRDTALGGGELADYSLTLARSFGNFVLAGKFTGTDARGERRISDGPFANDFRFVLALETTFPWEDASSDD